MTYSITIYRNGKAQVSKYMSLEAAKRIASEIFDKTNIVVGIEAHL